MAALLPPSLVTAGVKIFSLLPNPDGVDEAREEETIRNGTAEEVNLEGWLLRDRAGHQFKLAGTVSAQQHLTITMRELSMPLNNSGDNVSRLDPQGQARHYVSHSAAQAQPGQVVTLEG